MAAKKHAVSPANQERLKYWSDRFNPSEEIELNKLLEMGDNRRTTLNRNYEGVGDNRKPAPGRKRKATKKGKKS